MRLNELIKPKQIKKFQLEPTTQARPEGRQWNESHNWIKQSDAIAAHFGFSQLGSGSFAGVYGSPKYDFLIKLFTSDDQGYLDYLDFVRLNRQNPFVPKLRGSITKVTPSISFIRIEPLVPITSGRQDDKFEAFVTLVYDNDMWNTHDEVSSMEINVNKSFPNFRKNMHLQQICKFLAANDYLDLHTHNAMFRGDQLVITDPIAYV